MSFWNTNTPCPEWAQKWMNKWILPTVPLLRPRQAGSQLELGGWARPQRRGSAATTCSCDTPQGVERGEPQLGCSRSRT